MNPAVLRLAVRQLVSQLRTTEWRALILATWLAVALTTFLSLLGDRLENGLLRESASVLGADLVISSSRPIDKSRLTLADQFSLTKSEVIQFPSMIAAGDSMVLSSVRVVEAPYPLRGEVQTEPPQTASVPEPGTAWVEQPILNQLGVKVGDSVQFGYVDLKVSAVLLSSPDRGSGFRSLSPHMLVNKADLEASEVLAPGSRAQFRLLLAGAKAQTDRFEKAIKPRITESERLLSLTNDQPLTGNALGNGMAYLRLSALTALLLSALTIMLALRRFSLGQTKHNALLLSLGLRPADLVKLYVAQLLLAAAIIAVTGLLSGIVLERIADYWIADLLPQQLPAASGTSYLAGPILSFAMLLLLGLPPTFEQSRITVSQLFRGEEQDNASTQSKVLYILSLMLLGLTILAFLQAPLAAILLLVVLGVSGLQFGWLSQKLLHLACIPLAKKLTLGRLLNLRLNQQRKWHRLQSAVVVLLLMLLSVVWVSREDLIKEWRAQFPQDVPNYFVINIQEWQKPDLDKFLSERHIETELYPMVRGRLTELNGKPIKPQLNEEQLNNNALHRELNLTYRREMPEHNQLISGTWWTPDSTAAEISIERDMFQNLGLSLGDELSFNIGGQDIRGLITSVREVQWNSFKPNFYVIFSPGAIEGYPATWITSFKLADSNKHYASELLKTFPSLTLVDIDQLLAQLAGWLARLAESSALVLTLTLGCGLVLVAVTLLQALEQRRFESALLQTLGARSRQTQQLDLLEFALLGLVCGFLAAVSAEVMLGALHLYLLKIDPRWHFELWLSLPVLATLIFIGLSWLLRTPLKIEQCYQVLRSKT